MARCGSAKVPGSCWHKSAEEHGGCCPGLGGWWVARLRSASKELRRRGCILIWSNDRGGAPALKHCAGAHKMDGLVVTSKLQALKHCAGAAKIAGSEDGWLRLASKELRRRGCVLIWSNDQVLQIKRQSESRSFPPALPHHT